MESDADPIDALYEAASNAVKELLSAKEHKKLMAAEIDSLQTEKETLINKIHRLQGEEDKHAPCYVWVRTRVYCDVLGFCIKQELVGLFERLDTALACDDIHGQTSTWSSSSNDRYVHEVAGKYVKEVVRKEEIVQGNGKQCGS